MLTRLTSSTLFVNPTFISALTIETRSASSSITNNDQAWGKDWSVVTRMRELRARGPYALFVKQNYGDMKAKNPNLKMTDISKKIGEAWRALDEQKKQTYIKQFQEQRTKYQEEKSRLNATDLQTVDADEKSRRLENRLKKSVNQLPNKRPRTAFAHFLTTLDRGEADIKDYMKGAAQRWTQLTEQEKQKYEDLYQQEKQDYAKALVAWATANEQNLTQPKPKVKAKRAVSAAPVKEKKTKKTKSRAISATNKKKAS